MCGSEEKTWYLTSISHLLAICMGKTPRPIVVGASAKYLFQIMQEISLQMRALFHWSPLIEICV